MKPSRKDLKEALVDMTSADVTKLLHEALADRQRLEEERRAARCDDPLGTIRMYDDGGHSVMWVRNAGSRWDPWPHETHGLSVEDHQIPWRDYPIVGMMPPDWVAQEQEYQRDYED